MAGFGAASAAIEPEGRIGLLCRVSRLAEVACNGLAVDAQFARDLTLGQTLAVQGEDEVFHGHFEQIRHDAAPEKGGVPLEPICRICVSSKWLVFMILMRPLLAGFERPLTGAIVEHGMIIKSTTSVIQKGKVVATKEYLRANPAINIEVQMGRMMKDLLIEFGLTPSSRSRIRTTADQPKDELEEFLEQEA